MILQRMSLVASRHGRRVIRSVPIPMAASLSTLTPSTENKEFYTSSILAAMAMGGFALAVTSAAADTVTACDAHPHFTPSQVAKEAFPTGEDHEDEMDKQPIYTSDQVAENDGSDGKPIWMSYGGVVYDVTDFISNHPGGSEKVSDEMKSLSMRQAISLRH